MSKKIVKLKWNIECRPTFMNFLAFDDFCLKLVGTPLRRWKFFVFQSHFYLYLRERKDAFKAFQKTKYFTLCECKCTVIFNRKKGPPKLNGNLRNNMQSGSKHSRKQEFRHERDREEGEFGSEKRLKRSGDHNEGSNPRKRRRSRSPPPPRRSRSSPRRSPWVPLRKSKASRNNNKYWEIWKNISMWKIRIPNYSITFIWDGIFGLVFSMALHDDLGLSSHIGCFPCPYVAFVYLKNATIFHAGNRALSIKGIMNHVDSSIWQLLHSSAIGKHDWLWACDY